MTGSALRMLLCAWLLAIAGCSSSDRAEPAADMSMSAAEEVAGSDPAAAPAGEAGTSPSRLVSSAAAYEDGVRRFIRTARAEFQVDDVYRSALAIEDLVASHGGFVTRNEISSEVGRTRRHRRGERFHGRMIQTAQGELGVEDLARAEVAFPGHDDVGRLARVGVGIGLLKFLQ